jgi:hypothetical protein
MDTYAGQTFADVDRSDTVVELTADDTILEESDDTVLTTAAPPEEMSEDTIAS